MTGSNPLAPVASIFERSGVSYAIIGAHAVNAWVEPRYTADVDATIVATLQQFATLTANLLEADFVITRKYGGTPASGPDFIRFVGQRNQLILELQLAKTAFQLMVVERAITTPEGARVATPEDLLVMKAIANRGKDARDLHELAALQNLDWSYVLERAAEWGVVEALEQLRH